ncbi:hypothetical protein C8Q77DRAFT_785247 [Trametes polyzona]|nr:hypothetical protein C8Q77DRAFT_785247 [Trametes polyzona]
MSQPIVFYDILGRDTKPGSRACSPNTWKTRYTLNIKGIPYKTVWVELPDVEPLVRKLGGEPTAQKPDGSPYYSLPTIYDPNTKKVVSESGAIVRYLDRTYPDTPRLVPAGTDALHAAFNDAFQSLIGLDLIRCLVLATYAHVPPRSQAYFRPTREGWFGDKLEEIAPPGPKRDQHWAAVKKAFNTLAGWLQADGEDRQFFTGGKVAYADVIVASSLIWIRVVSGEESKEWRDISSWDGGRWARLVLEAMKVYEFVDAGEEVVVDATGLVG